MSSRAASRTGFSSPRIGQFSIATGEDSPQLCEVALLSAQNGNTLSELAVPPRFAYVPTVMFNVSFYDTGQLYSEYAHTIRTGQSRHPTFDTAVGLHHLIAALR